MMTTWAKPGVKCIYRAVRHNTHPTFRPFKGQVFTVESVNWVTHMKVVEMTNTGGAGPWWPIDSFAPVAYPKQSAEQDVAAFLHIANHIDPIIRADEYRQEMEESEARLERLWTAMRSFEL